MGSSTLTFKDGKLRTKAIFNLFGKLTFYDCLFFSIKQFPSSIQEKFNTVEEIYEVLQKKYQVSWKEIQFSFQETKYSFPLHQLPTIDLVLEENENERIALKA